MCSLRASSEVFPSSFIFSHPMVIWMALAAATFTPWKAESHEPSKDSARSLLSYASKFSVVQRTKNTKTKKKRATTRKETKNESSSSKMGIALNFGYESSYGNGIGLHVRLGSMVDLHSGLGYTLSGMRTGVGMDLLVAVHKAWEMVGGASIGYGSGASGKVTKEGSFTDDSGSQSSIRASRSYRLTPYTFASIRAGSRYKLTPTLQAFGLINYNLILSGNKAEFTGDIEYESPVQVSNAEEAQKSFEEKAKEEVQSGGPGFSVGLILSI